MAKVMRTLKGPTHILHAESRFLSPPRRLFSSISHNLSVSSHIIQCQLQPQRPLSHQAVSATTHTYRTQTQPVPINSYCHFQSTPTPFLPILSRNTTRRSRRRAAAACACSCAFLLALVCSTIDAGNLACSSSATLPPSSAAWRTRHPPPSIPASLSTSQGSSSSDSRASSSNVASLITEPVSSASTTASSSARGANLSASIDKVGSARERLGGDTLARAHVCLPAG